MKFLTIILIFLFACVNPKRYKTTTIKDFEYLQNRDTILLTIDEFYRNNAYCYTEGLPYALIIGKSNLGKKISVLALCDNDNYEIGERLNILPIENPINSSSLRPIYFVKDTLLDNSKVRWIIGCEYPAIWGKVIK